MTAPFYLRISEKSNVLSIWMNTYLVPRKKVKFQEITGRPVKFSEKTNCYDGISHILYHAKFVADRTVYLRWLLYAIPSRIFSFTFATWECLNIFFLNNKLNFYREMNENCMENLLLL